MKLVRVASGSSQILDLSNLKDYIMTGGVANYDPETGFIKLSEGSIERVIPLTYKVGDETYSFDSFDLIIELDSSNRGDNYSHHFYVRTSDDRLVGLTEDSEDNPVSRRYWRLVYSNNIVTAYVSDNKEDSSSWEVVTGISMIPQTKEVPVRFGFMVGRKSSSPMVIKFVTQKFNSIVTIRNVSSTQTVEIRDSEESIIAKGVGDDTTRVLSLEIPVPLPGGHVVVLVDNSEVCRSFYDTVYPGDEYRLVEYEILITYNGRVIVNNDGSRFKIPVRISKLMVFNQNDKVTARGITIYPSGRDLDFCGVTLTEPTDLKNLKLEKSFYISHLDPLENFPFYLITTKTRANSDSNITMIDLSVVVDQWEEVT